MDFMNYNRQNIIQLIVKIGKRIVFYITTYDMTNLLHITCASAFPDVKHILQHIVMYSVGLCWGLGFLHALIVNFRGRT